jgi:hypothetical protein
MTYELPEPQYFVTHDYADRPTFNPHYSAEQMQDAHAAGRKEALEDAAKELLKSFGMYVAVEVIRSMK